MLVGFMRREILRRELPIALQIVYRDVNQIPAVGSPSCVATGVEITAMAGTIQNDTCKVISLE
jgi:hypothetical protein